MGDKPQDLNSESTLCLVPRNISTTAFDDIYKRTGVITDALQRIITQDQLGFENMQEGEQLYFTSLKGMEGPYLSLHEVIERIYTDFGVRILMIALPSRNAIQIQCVIADITLE